LEKIDGFKCPMMTCVIQPIQQSLHSKQFLLIPPFLSKTKNSKMNASIIISQYLYDIHFLKKDKKDTKMNYTETVVILFDILHDRTLDENDYKIRYSAILSTGDVSPPKEITIKIDTTIHDMISAYEFETRADGADDD
jgi:hypothetical protein